MFFFKENIFGRIKKTSNLFKEIIAPIYVLSELTLLVWIHMNGESKK